MPEPTAAAEPLDDPPGVRDPSCGFCVLCQGCVAANSAYVHLKKPQRVTMTELYT